LSQRLPRVTTDDVINALEKLGFGLSRQSGSHRIYKNPQGKRVTVPYHKGKTLHPKILRSIVKDVGISLDEFLKFL
jgi:predicted RNA binding protein YcfA (HicA-like mRNA interferase family)